MAGRVDSASALIGASPEAIYRAFAEPGALERWLPPDGMTGKMLRFDFREGGGYRLRLTYDDAGPGAGKTSQDTDEVEVRLTRLEPGRRIEGEGIFEGDDPAFAGTMRMAWTFEPEGRATRVTVRAEDVPEGIRPQDHQAGLKSPLENLAAYVQRKA